MPATTFTSSDGNVVSIDERLAAETLHDYIFGGRGRELSTEALAEVYISCDGFGDCSSGERREWLVDYMKGGWDWSHVRDSSPQGFHRALGVLVEKIEGGRS